MILKRLNSVIQLPRNCHKEEENLDFKKRMELFFLKILHFRFHWGGFFFYRQLIIGTRVLLTTNMLIFIFFIFITTMKIKIAVITRHKRYCSASQLRSVKPNVHFICATSFNYLTDPRMILIEITLTLFM
jgi:hypothetical protein